MINTYITHPTVFPFLTEKPWQVVENLCEQVSRLIETLGDEYEVKDGVAIHQSAVIGHNVTIKAPAIISANCFVGSNSYLRGGVFMAPGAKVGISCEVKTLANPARSTKRVQKMEEKSRVRFTSFCTTRW